MRRRNQFKTNADSTLQNTWQRETFATQEEMERLASEASEALSLDNILHDLRYICAEHNWPQKELLVLTDREGGRLTGLAVFRVANTPITAKLGPLVLVRWKVRRLYLYQGPISRRPNHSDAISRCIAALALAMGKATAVYVEAVPTDSQFFFQINDRAGSAWRHFYALPFGQAGPRCGIRWQGTVAAYFNSLPGKLSDVKRSRRKLFSNPSLTCRVARFQSVQDLDTFFKDGSAVSDTTYQARDLGRALSRGGAVERTIAEAAARGCFLGYILYINDKPVAFDYGFVFGGTFVNTQGGYDPAWASHKIGSVLFFEMLHDIERQKIPINYIDQLTYVTVFKLRTTNEQSETHSYYLFKRSAVGFFQYASLRIGIEISERGKALYRWAARLRRSGVNGPPQVSRRGQPNLEQRARE